MRSSFLHYSSPARCFEEALPIGNGLMGAMVYGGRTEDRISLNHCHLWSGEPHRHENPKAKEALSRAQALAREDRLTEAQELLERDFSSHWSESFLPLGELKIMLPPLDGRCYRRRLDLSEATVRITQGKENDALQRSYFASRPDGVIAVSYHLKKAEDVEIVFFSPLRGSLSFEDSMLIYRGRCPYLQYPNYYYKHSEKSSRYAKDRGIPFTFALKAVTDGSLTEYTDRLVAENATYLELYCTCRTGFVSPDALPHKEHESQAKQTVLAACEKGMAAVHQRHKEDFSSLYGRVELTLDTLEEPPFTDKLLQEPHLPTLTKLLFDYGRYLLICSSRDGSAANLQGIWNEHRFAPWSANYTLNINTEMNYWPAGICNLDECAMPLAQLVEAIHRHGQVTAREFYSAPGFVCHHNSDLWAHTEPVGAGEAGCATFSFWPMASGWLACQLWDLYEYQPEALIKKEELDRILRDASRFYLHLLTENEKGKLVLSPATSPENTFRSPHGDDLVSVGRWSAMSQQILQQLFLSCLQLQRQLHSDPALEAQLAAALPRLQETLLSPDGSVCEWDRDYLQADHKHRHLSHLWGLFPGALFQDDPVMKEACRKTLRARGDEGTGWSLGWKINLFARLGDGDHALKLLANQLSPCLPDEKVNLHRGGTYPNLLDAHPPFQIDGNFGATAGIASLFLYSTPHELHLLPALPALLKNGSIRGLRAKGGVICDVCWENGELSEARLSCDLPRTFTLVTPEGRRTVSLTGRAPYLYRKGSKTDVPL